MRKIIKINEEKCDGCGLCIPNCPEGAMQIIDNKARLVSDLFCDGLGACIGHCPKQAITIEEREAEEHDEKKASACGCPGANGLQNQGIGNTKSQLRQWPVQLMLVPHSAPYLDNSDLLIAADCVPFAYAAFHESLLKGKIVLVSCPKFDNTELYQNKITEIFKHNKINSITYAYMEVPCCFGLVNIIKDAIRNSGKDVPFSEAVISIKGERIK